MKTLALIGTIAAMLAAPASAHLVRTGPLPSKDRALERRIARVETNLAHTRYVARHGRGRVKLSHARATRWLRELRGDLELELLLATVRNDPIAAIRYAFATAGAGVADVMVKVSDCETGGTFSVWASNGQYLGLFQMGAGERATYGHGTTALEQAQAARRAFDARGFGPWRGFGCL